MKLSVIIPVYNEEKTVKRLIDLVKGSNIGNYEKEIIVVDDFSSDGTRDVLGKISSIKLLFHNRNMGKGAALKTGIGNSSGDIIIVQDADMEYSPNEYLKLMKPIVGGNTKVVYGSRLLKKKNKQGRWWFYFGGRTISAFANLLYGSRLTDEPTCYKVFHKDLKPILLNARGNRFEWEPEVTAKIIRKGHRIFEIPISYNPRSGKEGKKIGAKDGLWALWTLFEWRFRRIDS